MGCSGSKAEDLPLVVRCRERREFIRAAANHRYALAAAHVSYFRSLKDVGDALRKFVDEELITSTSPSDSSSSFSSPSLILPPNSKPKSKSKPKHTNVDESSLHLHHDDDDDEDDDDDSHLDLSDSSDEEDDDKHQHLHHHGNRGFNNEEEYSSIPPNHYPGAGFNGYEQGYGQGYGQGMANDPYMYPYPYPPSYPSYGGQYMDPWYQTGNTNVYYMKKSAPATRTVIHETPPDLSYGYSDSHWTSPPVGYGNGVNYGYLPMEGNGGPKLKPQKEVPPPPSPKASTWDFFNPFDAFDGGYTGGYYSSLGNGYRSETGSPDSSEVREREGIPDLEEETETEAYKEVLHRKKMKAHRQKNSGETQSENREGRPKSMPLHNNEGNSRSAPMYKTEDTSGSVSLHTTDTSSRSLPSWTSSESEKQSVPPQFNRTTAKPSMPPHYREEGMKQTMPPYYGEDGMKPSMHPPQYSEEGMKPSMPPPQSKGTSWVVQSSNGDMDSSVHFTDEKSSSENIISTNVDESSVKKRGVTFEVDGTSKQDGESSVLSSVTLLSPHGNRDLREVVAEIRDEFEIASGYGKEVAMMLEVGKVPYQPSFLKVITSQILYLISPSMSLMDPPSLESAKLASRTMKSAKSYFEDVGKDVNVNACNLSSTLDKLYAWEMKLYKEVKDEERVRVLYEKQYKRLKTLDKEGAETTKIGAAQASIRRLLTKLDVSVKAIDGISRRIHKLRDEELHPQVAELIYGLIRMWKAMLQCHQKQFQAIMESKMRKLKANTVDSSSRAISELERELCAWSGSFNDWITSQKSYVESLNGWLLQCLHYEPEETPDGPVPYSPGRLGAPPIFVILNDWHQAMEAISEARVANAMTNFATSLRQLWEKQDEEGRQRLKAEYLSRDIEKQLRTHHVDKGKLDHEQDTLSDKTGMSVVQSDSGISPLDDLKVDLDSMRQKLAEERIKHKDAMKLVHDAASSSLQGGLIPIFKALESFTSEALKAHEHVRLEAHRQN